MQMFANFVIKLSSIILIKLRKGKMAESLRQFSLFYVGKFVLPHLVTAGVPHHHPRPLPVPSSSSSFVLY